MRALAFVTCMVMGISALTCPPALAQSRSEASAKIPQFLGLRGDSEFFNGGIVVKDSEQTIVYEAHGAADFSTSTPLETGSVFQTASMSKPFTSTAILQLRDRGKLKLDDPVAKYLTGFPFPGITLRHLLTHTSGLPDLELFEDMVKSDPGRLIAGSDLVPALKAWPQKLASTPGDKFRYSNINYQLLARIVEVASRRPFGEYLRESIFRPAGMKSSYALGTSAIGPTRSAVANHILPTMFQMIPQNVRAVTTGNPNRLRSIRYETFNLGSTLGDQNVFTTLEDLQRFDASLRNGKVLSLTSQLEAYTPARLNDGSSYLDAEVYVIYGVACSYGMGWEVCSHPKFGRIVGHAGYNQGIQTILYRNLDRDQLIAMYDNADKPDFAQKVASVANLLNGEPPLDVARQRSLSRAYGDVLVREGVAAGLVFFNRHRNDQVNWSFTGPGLNRLGYDLLTDRKPELAVEVFQLNVALNPDNAAFYDSWGEGLAVLGKKADAIIAYRRSFELQPENERGRTALELLLQN